MLAASVGAERPDARGLDLWARIAAQEGRYAEAAQAWRAALAMDAATPGARGALELAAQRALRQGAAAVAPAPSPAVVADEVHVWTTRAGDVVAVRGPSVAVLGVAEEALVGRRLAKRFTGAYARADARSAAEAWRGEVVGPCPAKWAWPDGTVVRIETVVAPVVNEVGEVLALRRVIRGRRWPPFS